MKLTMALGAVAAGVTVVVAALVLSSDGSEDPLTPRTDQGRVGAQVQVDADVEDGGPIVEVPPHGWFVRGASGKVFTDGLERLELSGALPATLLAIESVGTGASLELFDAMIAGPERTMGAIQTVPRFPPEAKSLGELEELEGLTIAPFDQTDEWGHVLILGYRITSDQPAVREGLRVTCEVEGTTYERFVPARLIYCGASMRGRECDAYADDQFPDG